MSTVFSKEKNLKYDPNYDSASAAKSGLMGTVDIVISGQVAAFNANTEESSTGFGVMGKHTITGVVSLKIRANLISVEKGSILLAPDADKDMKDILASDYKGSFMGKSMSTSDSRKSLDEGLRKLVDKAATSVAQELSTKINPLVVASGANLSTRKPPPAAPIQIAINNNNLNSLPAHVQPPSSPPVAATASPVTQIPSKLASLDPELLSRLDDAQGRLAAEKSYWENVKAHMPPGSSLRPEITSQIYAADSTSQRCSKDRQTLDATGLSSCVDALNDHLNQLHIQR